jgi:tripartite-type tricarboxylate transporter receptor subunit TctC
MESKTRLKQLLNAMISLCVLALAPGMASAQASPAALPAPLALTAAAPYPSKPIRLIVPYAAGGPVDAVARLIAEGSKLTLGQLMVVDNKPGAGGNLGVDLLAKSPADGYTLVMGAVATHAINPALSQRGGAKVNYDALKDFAPVALAASIPNVLIVNKAFATQQGIGTFADFVRVLKAKPGAFDLASGGTGSAGHLAGELLKAQAGVYAVHIPYSGAAPAVASVLAGQTQFMFDNLASATAQIKAGTVLALAVTTAQRAASLPHLPTVAELADSPALTKAAALVKAAKVEKTDKTNKINKTDKTDKKNQIDTLSAHLPDSSRTGGLRSFDVSTWFGIFAPAGTPPAVVTALNHAVRSTLSTPANAERLKTLGTDAAPWDAARFAAFVAAEHSKYAAVIQAANVRID